MQEGREKRRRTRVSADPLGDGPAPPTRSPASLCKELPWRAGCHEHRCRGCRCRAQKEGLRGRRALRDVPTPVTVLRGGEGRDRTCIQSQAPSQARPLDEISPPTWTQDHPAPQRGLQETPAESLPGCSCLGLSDQRPRGYVQQSGSLQEVEETKTPAADSKLRWLGGVSCASLLITHLQWQVSSSAMGHGHFHLLVLCPGLASLLPLYLLSTPSMLPTPARGLASWPLYHSHSFSPLHIL